MRLRRIGMVAVTVLVVGLAAGAGGTSSSARPRRCRRGRLAAGRRKEGQGELRRRRGRGRPRAPAGKPRTSLGAVPAVPGDGPRVRALRAGRASGPPVGQESAAADYIVQKLGEYGYTVEEQPFTTSRRLSSRNIVARAQGSDDNYTLIIGAHYDSPSGSTGADDDASGVGTVLELAGSSPRGRSSRPCSSCSSGRTSRASRPGRRVWRDRGGTSTCSDRWTRTDVAGMIERGLRRAGDTLALSTQGSGLQRLKDKLETYAREKNHRSPL